MINTKQYKHHERFKNLFEVCRQDWEEWNKTHNIEKETVNAGVVYEADLLDDRCGWWGVPAVSYTHLRAHET